MKVDVDLWQEDLGTENEAIENFMSILEEHEADIYEVCLPDSSKEVARVIARYIVRKLQAKLKCEDCALLMIDGSEDASERDRYLPKSFISRLSHKTIGTNGRICDKLICTFRFTPEVHQVHISEKTLSTSHGKVCC